jgi:hypothetical protein
MTSSGQATVTPGTTSKGEPQTTLDRRNGQKPWRIDGNISDTCNSDVGDMSDNDDLKKGALWTLMQTAAKNEEGWESDSSEDPRNRRDRLLAAGLDLNQIDVSEDSVPLSKAETLTMDDSNGRSTMVNELMKESIISLSQQQSTQTRKIKPSGNIIDGLTSDVDEDDIVYEADWVDSSDDCDDFPDDPAPSPKARTPEEQVPGDQPMHRRTSSESIEYEADEVTEIKALPTNTAEPPEEMITAHKESCAFDDTLSGFVQTAKFAVAKEKSMQDITTLIMGKQSQATLYNFAMEHRIFAKALLALLAQRDQYRPDEMAMDGPIIKAGPLKKASHLVRGVWRVKYVEIRKGIFSYFEDAEHEAGQLLRKNIPLNATLLKCRPVKVNHNALTNASGEAIFELSKEAGPRRLWMANSKDERQAWMRAIQDAMVGGSLTRGGENNGNDNKYNLKRQVQRSPYRKDIERYLKIQKEIKHSSNKDMYVGALSKLLGSSLNVPVQWITEQANAADENDKAFHEDNVSSGVDQLYKDLQRDTVKINEEVFQGGSGHSPEKIIGAITRDIMKFDRSSPLHAADQEHTRRHKDLISELQALSFARDILLSGNRTRSGGDSYFCVDTLCHHQELVVTVPNSLEAEPWKVTITHAVPTKTSGNVYSLNDRSGWLRTRSKPQKPWKRRFFVYSEGTLSYYEKAQPRPHRLRGQINLVDCHVNAIRVKSKPMKGEDIFDEDKSPLFLVSIVNREGGLERQILFDDAKRFLAWAHGFEASIKKKSANVLTSPQQKHRFRMRPHLGLREEQLDEGVTVGGISLGDDSLSANASRLGLDSDYVAQRIVALSNQGGKGQSTVKISVEASTDYNVCTTDPQGDVEEDTWATIRATFLQSFRVCGGPNGRIVRGEEIVRVKILKCCDFRRVVKESAISPRELAGMMSRKLRRFGSQDSGFT